MNLIYYRAGSYNMLDKIIGFIIFILILEFARREHKILLYVVIFLMLYSIYGRVFPGIFHHPGISWARMIQSSTIEVKLGVFGTYAQTGVAVIAAFFLLMGVAQGFGIQKSLVITVIGILGKRISLVPQTAVVSSMAVATASGSGAANVSITGQYTIPLMKRVGFPPVYAGAVEASASLGGLIMPPVMAIAAFLMADFLGVSYFHVIARGYAPALVYYASIGLSVYLITLRYVQTRRINKTNLALTPVIEKFSRLDVMNTIIFFSFIGVLVILMGLLWWEPAKAAFWSGCVLLIICLLIRGYTYEGTISDKVKEIGRNFFEAVGAYARITVSIVLLLSVLGILVNLFSVSGWLLKLGGMMMMIGEANIFALIGMAFLVGVFLGLGLPPSATYVMVAVLITPAMVKFGFNPWVAHFFAFFLAVISEYSPPTSLTAAVASQISGASFMRTMFETLKISLPVLFITFGILNWDVLVVKPGLKQLATIGILIIACGLSATGIYGKFAKQRMKDIVLRSLCLLLTIFILFYPKGIPSILALIPATIMLGLGIRRSQKIFLSS